MRKLAFLFIVIFLNLNARAFGDEISNNFNVENILFTDLRDVARYKSQEFPLSVSILNLLENCESCLPDQLHFTKKGPERLEMTRTNVIYGVELTQKPQFTEQEAIFQIQAIGVHSDRRIFYYLGNFNISLDFKKINKAKWDRHSINSQTQFQIVVGRWDRKLVVKSQQPAFQKIYPVAVGGFSLDYATIQTPLMQGLIKQSHPRFYESREEPWYYYGFPFLGILNNSQDYTGYGIHGTLLPAADNFNRGFVSTGCIQMQVKDVYEIFALVKYSNSSRTQISVQDRLTKEFAALDSVVPYNNTYHYRVKDGSRGDDGLTKMIRIDNPPPTNR